MSPRRRLVVVASTFPASVDDGTPAFVRDLAVHEAERFDTVALVPRVPGAPARERVGALEVVRFAYFPRRWEDLADGAILENLKARPTRALQLLPLVVAEVLALRRLVRRHSPDVVQAHWILPQGLAARLAAPGVPLVVTAHGGDVYALTGRLASRVKGWVVRSAAAVTAPNRDMCRRLVVLGAPADRTTPGPMGADVDSVRGVRGLAREPGRILFVGRLAEKKGVRHLLAALRRLGDDLPWSLHVVGDGPLRAVLEADAADLGDRVTFHGARPRPFVVDQLHRCSVFALPSVRAVSGDQDGLPVVLLEAMAAGCAVVASRLPGIDEAVTDGETGHLVEPGDEAALADALRRLLTAPPDTLAALGRAASTAADGHSVAAVGERFAALLAAAADGPAARTGSGSP